MGPTTICLTLRRSATSQFICQWENEPGGVPLRIKHLLHSSAVRYGEIFHLPSAREISRHISR